MQQKKTRRVLAAAAIASFINLAAMPAALAAAPSAAEIATWNEPVEPFKVYGNTYYVGTKNLGSVLITSDYGHVLIDGGLPASAPIIAANIAKLGFKVTDIKAILQSHAHPDHVGGIAELQKLSGAAVYARRPADEVMRTGKLPKEDPQYSKSTKIATVPTVWVVHGDQLLGVGSNRLRALATGGHTPGGTSWAWESCDDGKCLQFVYADSLSPVAGAKYRYSDHPEVLAAFEEGYKALEAQRCEVLITPHPEASKFLERVQKAGGKLDALKDPEACKQYVATGRQNLAQRLEQEKSGASKK
jgi:metallo-beta-lactamase class B